MKKEFRARISSHPDLRGGEPFISGTRIPVGVVVARMAQGLSRRDIVREYPQLKDKDITAALLYASESVRKKSIKPERPSVFDVGTEVAAVPSESGDDGGPEFGRPEVIFPGETRELPRPLFSAIWPTQLWHVRPLTSDPTIQFELLTSTDVVSGLFSCGAVPSDMLRQRIVLARTGNGLFAKLKILADGSCVHMTRVALYNPEECLIRTDQNVVLQEGSDYDLETGQFRSFGMGSLGWARNAFGIRYLEAHCGGMFCLWHGFDEVGLTEIRNASYETLPVDGAALMDQVIFCQSGSGRCAKLLLRRAGSKLAVERLVAFESDGTATGELGGISVSVGRTIQMDPGRSSKSRLTWDGDQLIPSGGAAISFASYYRFSKEVKRDAVRLLS